MNIYVAIYLVVHAISAAISYPLGFALLQRKFCLLAEEDYVGDLLFSLLMAVFLGPFNLIGVLVWFEGGKYGFKFK